MRSRKLCNEARVLAERLMTEAGLRTAGRRLRRGPSRPSSNEAEMTEDAVRCDRVVDEGEQDAASSTSAAFQ